MPSRLLHNFLSTRCIIHHLGQAARLLSTSGASTRKLSGQKCIITGGSRGIGRAIAHRFVAEGSSCVLIGRTEKTLTEAVEELESTMPKEGTEPEEREGGGGGRPRCIEYVVGNVAERDFWSSLKRREIFVCHNFWLRSSDQRIYRHHWMLLVVTESIAEMMFVERR